ncbi:GNAT family N-acetyltransferase [Actinoplanes sp. RD1]|uniref:GNAT family N-acetyltransferase n=1 Tax=Actinoplanes sp. RD1 TaxID=3064538 RepID=UPI0027428308|nr:GNAT family N-acetyltransferase [Actinoplanes sp. RD1]
MELPEVIDAGPVELRRWEPAMAEEATAAVRESLPEFKPFLPWATDGYDLASSRDFIERSIESWAKGTEFNYAMYARGGGLVGSIGLMTRMGPDVLEIGYWVRTSQAGRGYMTAAVEAITPVALAQPGIARAAIRHDAGNGASAAVAIKAGFAEVARVPNDTNGTDVIRERRA